MASKKRARRSKKFSAQSKTTLLALSVGVIFFTLQLLFLANPNIVQVGLTGILTAIWVISGVIMALGVVEAARESKWAVFLLAAPAFSFALFALLMAMDTLGSTLLSTTFDLM